MDSGLALRAPRNDKDPLVAGLFKRKALEPAFDVEAERRMVLGVLEALFAGRMAPDTEV